MTDNWQDLSGSEVIARLTNRGVPLPEARALVGDHLRGIPQAESRITAIICHPAGRGVPVPV